MSALFGGGSDAQPTPIPTPVSLPTISASSYATMSQAARLAGMAGTVKTSGQGVTTPVSTTKKVLTGQ